MTRASRRIAAILTLFALLFAQAMVSAHACDVFGSAKAPVAAVATETPEGDCCDGHGPPGDAVCGSHCQQGNQAAERGQVLSVMPLVDLGFALPAPILVPAARPAFVSAVPDLARGTQPPIPIRNCCFRI